MFRWALQDLALAGRSLEVSLLGGKWCQDCGDFWGVKKVRLLLSTACSLRALALPLWLSCGYWGQNYSTFLLNCNKG
jgi:hypothetical protein